MKRLDQRGSSTALIIAFVLTLLLFFGAAGFGVWAFAGRQDYKNNVEPKITAAVEIAKKETSTTKDNEFVEKEKQPLKDYIGPQPYGSLLVKYPKTWSAYVNESSQSNTPVDGYLHPNYVPGLQSSAAFALRVQVVSDAYDQVLKQFASLVKGGKVKVTAYSAAKVPSIVGSRLDGQIVPTKQGSMVLFPLRDKTLKVWTEANQFVGDFDTNILPNLSFSP